MPHINKKSRAKTSRKKIVVGLLVSAGAVALMVGGASAMKHKGEGGYGHHGSRGMPFEMRKKMMQERFKAADKDADGFISKTEFETHRAANFAKKDLDSDGFIASTELDGLVSAKVGERADRLLKKFDKNADGSVTKDEIVATLSEKMSERMKRRIGRRLKRMDKNWDGKVSKEEFERMTQRRFERKDKDGDGKLSLVEMRKGGKHHGRKMRHHGRRHGGEDYRGGRGSR